jgi:hypothetical protein
MGLSDRYEKAEAAYLSALRADAPRVELASLAKAVAEAAAAVESAAWPEHFAAQKAGNDDLIRDTDNLAERAEVVAELWRDIAGAYDPPS